MTWSDVEEAVRGDRRAQGPDAGTDEQEPEADAPHLTVVNSEVLKEVQHVVAAQPPIEGLVRALHHAAAQPRANEPLDGALQHERDANEPVRGTHQLHDLDLASPSKHGHTDGVEDEEQAGA